MIVIFVAGGVMICLAEKEISPDARGALSR